MVVGTRFFILLWVLEEHVDEFSSYAETSEHSNIYSYVAWYMLHLWQKDFYWAFTEWDSVSHYLTHIWPD